MGRRAREELSERQKKIWRCIYKYEKEHQRPPTVREIREECNISSTSLVDYHLRQLEQKGFIVREKGKARGIILLRRPGGVERRAINVPLYGSIAAGKPIPSTQQRDPEDVVTIWRDLLPPLAEDKLDSLFALRVQGDSMIDALVGDGDLIICLRDNNPKNGQMVAAWLPERNEATLKYYYLVAPDDPSVPPSSNGMEADEVAQPDPEEVVEALREKVRVRLVPANSAYEPIELPADQVEVHGRVVLVVRQFA